MAADIIFKQFFVSLPRNAKAVAAMEAIGGFKLTPYFTMVLEQNKAYLWVMETGSRNMVNHDGTIARDWSIIASGERMINRALLMCPDIESGMILPGGRESLPENFIIRVRNRLKVALPLESVYVPRLAWSFPASLIDAESQAPTEERKSRAFQSAAQMRSNEYTAHLISSGRLRLERDVWPFEKEINASFDSAGSNDESFLADWLWLSMLTTWHGESVGRLKCGQCLNSMFANWYEKSMQIDAAA